MRHVEKLEQPEKGHTESSHESLKMKSGGNQSPTRMKFKRKAKGQ